MAKFHLNSPQINGSDGVCNISIGDLATGV